MKTLLIGCTILLTTGCATVSQPANFEFIDLSHPIPTFAPEKSDATKPDLTQPINNSTPIAGFYQQAILFPADKWATSQGHFNSRAILIQEHNGTSFNAPNHYYNDDISTEKGAIPFNKRKAAHQLGSEQLTGNIVLIDVSHRVKAELAKNGGKPSSDLKVTDFSDTSSATIRASDIRAVADKITDGAWLVGRVGWEQFYFSGTEDWDTSQYVNGLNHPGFTSEAIEEILKIMDEKKIKISGIAADSFSTDSGQGAKGVDDKWRNAWPAHVRLYQRDILIVENLTNLSLLAQQQGDCSLMVGALNHVGGTGGPARVMAVCEEQATSNAATKFRHRHR
ncbi:cyclase family protein [Pseudoalteromonas denitrificans]|uniref:Kynurenine formamidase n=1 Tax=Pseudoalteromonas denitrificans DSM 6059 TaxID=1123010 RepID=A0A1I1K975_9GAMM|nr:cyclase family protein [Pseudoalteromonas denitrificans]SFC57296.1 Kynurenine formamidase [Pseudoalteromonas denitrificans DSM 6059]